jgi:osmotically-inducible protein OsmY
MTYYSRTESIHHGFDDVDLSQRVQMYLSSKDCPAFRNLVVEAERGVVTLSGRLENVRQRETALNSCRRVAGVLRLVDAIQVAEREPACARRTPR